MNLGEKCFQVVEEPGYDVKVGATIDTQFISFKDFELPMRFLLLLLLLGPCAAQADVEIIPLRFRTVDQVIPVLRPLVEPGGALSGMQGQIIVRASAANIADLRRVLAIVDTQQRRLLISVRQDMEGSESGRGVGVSGTVGSDRFSISNESARDSANSGSGVNLQLGDGSARRDERVDQQVQALEGMPAYISTGQSQPLPAGNVTRAPNGTLIVSNSVAYHDVSTGFEVMPRLAGDRVFLDINPRRETPGPGGTVNVQRMSTSASGRLGEWFEIGGLTISASSQSGGILSSSNSQRQENRRVWVKVEELK